MALQCTNWEPLLLRGAAARPGFDFHPVETAVDKEKHSEPCPPSFGFVTRPPPLNPPPPYGIDMPSHTQIVYVSRLPAVSPALFPRPSWRSRLKGPFDVPVAGRRRPQLHRSGTSPHRHQHFSFFHDSRLLRHSKAILGIPGCPTLTARFRTVTCYHLDLPMQSNRTLTLRRAKLPSKSLRSFFESVSPSAAVCRGLRSAANLVAFMA